MASLYRTYRPRTFADVVGQEHIVRTLTGAVDQNRVAHAYLFSGPRGTGKTSMAKILAKALNCTAGPTSTPDGTCPVCLAIHEQRALDVIELDAASHRGIDDIREIRERVAQQPVEGRYKVYILDEAHSLTTDASNALLKTLEEPPEHVVFVLCTTDPVKLLPTIRSRCQRFAFRRPSPGDLVSVMRSVCERESITAADAALHLVARAAGGSFRDALTILDQLSTSTGGTVELDEAARLLGLVSDDALFELVDLVIDQKPGNLLQRLDELAEHGQDLVGLLTTLLEHLRLVYLLQHAGALPASEATTADRLADLERQARALPAAETLRAVDALSTALREVRDGADPRLSLEVALIAAASPQSAPGLTGLLARVERLEHGSVVAGATSTPVAVVAVSAPPPAPPSPPTAQDVDAAALMQAWPQVLSALRGPARGVLAGARVTDIDEDRVTVVVSAPLLTTAQNYSEALCEAIVATTAQRVRIRFAAGQSEPAAPAPEPEQADSPGELLTGLELFDELRDRTNATEVIE